MMTPIEEQPAAEPVALALQLIDKWLGLGPAGMESVRKELDALYAHPAPAADPQQSMLRTTAREWFEAALREASKAAKCIEDGKRHYIIQSARNEWNKHEQSAHPTPAAEPYPEAAEVCAEAYQVVGSLLDDLGVFDTELATKILDNLSEHRMVHTDVLPWPSFAAKPMSDALDALRELVACNDAMDVFTREWIAAERWTDADAERTEIIYAREKKAWANVHAILAAHDVRRRAARPAWIGCGECDCLFQCHNGETRCIRMPLLASPT